MAKEQRSLFGEILDWMLAPLLLLWPMSLGLTGLVAQEIAGRPYDRALGESARLLARQIVVLPAPRSDVLPGVRLPPGRSLDLLRADDTDRIYLQVIGLRGELLAGDRDLPLPEVEQATDGEVFFRDEQMREEQVRVAYLWVAAADLNGPRRLLVQYAETLDKRSRLTAEIIKGVILPQFLILPLAVLLVWFALFKGTQPLNDLQQRIRQRESGDLSPIDELDAPDEVVPLVASINDLLQRLDRSIAMQKHFLADAAHQLKTPLAGLRMQAEIAVREIDAGHDDPRSLRSALRQIALSSERAARAVDQLLLLARAEDREQALQREVLDLASITRDAVLDLYPKAQDKGIDLGYEGAEPGSTARMSGQPVLLGELVRNLVDNALKYTPTGGTVTVRVLPDPFGGEIVLQVEDSGPGIALAERALVFRPFYRALGTGVDGTGLGLAIVQEIARGHDARITVDEAPSLRGLPGQGPGALFTVRFALRPAMR